MGDPKGFLKVARAKAKERPTEERSQHWHEFVEPRPKDVLEGQASRCMDCGIPFCHQGCPLGNLIPEWNDLVYRGRLEEARGRLEETNNFPEVTGRVCPAPCEASCVLNLEGTPVTIKDIERSIAEDTFDAGPLVPRIPSRKTGKKVAVIGSGPAGLAIAQQLARAGHDAHLYERDDRIGGLLRYGIPDFKMEKGILDRRMEQMRAEGVTFHTSVDVGLTVTGDDLRARHDAVVLALGARAPRDLPVAGRQLGGVHFAMEFLVQQNKRVAGDAVPDAGAILATGKRVIVLGGGDTGSDCVGTSLRHKAASVQQLELMPKPPLVRMPVNPWPEWPLILRTSSSHEEGAGGALERDWAVMTKRLVGKDGRVTALEAVRVESRGGKLVEVEGSTFEIPCDLVLLAMGFVGPEKPGIVEQLGLTLDPRGNVATRADGATNVPGVFAAGDVSRGQSLVVWAIADGRRVASGVDAWLSGTATSLASERRAAVG
ncbi:MAG TPA: glutamate synthase subunit beta [Polyangiaceae bacterium]|jgi:glutamate synthase (NADPH/NADH) small chain